MTFKKIERLYESYCMENQTSLAERKLVEDFLKYYQQSPIEKQCRLKEMLGKLSQPLETFKKSNGKTRPGWFPHDELGYPIADHCRRYRINKEDSLVCHPYPLGNDSLKKIVEQCEKHNLSCSIDGHSDYFLGVTSRLIFTRKRK